MNPSCAHPTVGLVARDISLHAGTRCLLQPLSVQLHVGRVTAILGPNGAGKSTLLSLLCGQRRPDVGEVWLDGVPLAAQAPQALARRRALLPQDTQIAFDFSARDVTELGRYPHRESPSADEAGIVDAALHAAGVHALATRRVPTLSGGERARVQLARVLAQIWEPPADGASRWLLMDEPTAALDLHHQREVLRLARDWAHRQGVGVVAVLHDLNLALRYADEVLVLDGGALVARGEPRTTLDKTLLARVWRVQAHPVYAPDGVAQLLMA